MAIERTETLLHWNHFLTLEEDLLTISRYVEFANVYDENGNSYNNNSTFSAEIAKLLLNIGSEVDVVLKEICKKYNVNTSKANIKTYMNTVKTHIPYFTNVIVNIPRLGIKNLTPWEQWDNSKSPLWWQAYNNVKHNRNLYFHEANIKNCLNAAAALYICVLILYKDKANSGKLPQLPKLFNIEDQYFGGTSMGRDGFSFRYNL